jgi:hypothetical protein
VIERPHLVDVPRRDEQPPDQFAQSGADEQGIDP